MAKVISRECPEFLEEQKADPSASCIYVVEINFAILFFNS
jgi:hypothetical protein